MEENKSLLSSEDYNKAGLEADQEIANAMEEYEAVVTSEQMQKIEKLRTKACLACRKCCEISLMPVDLTGTDEFKFYEIKGFEFFIMAGRMFTIIHRKCQHLTPLGCKIYDKRPEGCRKYDGRGDPVLTKICKWHDIKEDPENLRPRIKSMEDAPRKSLKEVEEERKNGQKV